jgi:hypothetical protein
VPRGNNGLHGAKSSAPVGAASRRGNFDFDRVSAELVRAVRGDRSQAALSRSFGYRSNIVSRWEACAAFPTASRFLGLLAEHSPERPSYVATFFGRVPVVFGGIEPTSRAGVAAFLRELRGKTPILSVARDAGVNRYSVSRWLSGDSEPRLPELLLLVQVMSGRVLDLLACFCDPKRMSSVVRAWAELELTRSLAYEMPWSHAVLRALELDDAGHQHQKAWLSERLGIPVSEVARALQALVQTGQVKKEGGRFRLQRVISVDTSRDREKRHGLKVAWTRTALERLETGAPSYSGYSVFAISRADLRRLRELHLEYVRAMQYVIGASEPGECVGLFCVQLLDLASASNALA